MKISVIIPVYNEALNIGILSQKVHDIIGQDNELIIVDDGSSDNTIGEINPSICKILSHRENRGKGQAMRTGIEASKGDLIVFMGGDGQDDPEEIPKLIRGIEEGADFVIGSRFVDNKSIDPKDKESERRYSGASVKPINELGNKFLTSLINLLFGTRITDSQSEFKCIKAEKLKRFSFQSDNYEIETEMLICASRAGLKICEVPVHRYQRRHGISHLYQVPFGRLKFGFWVMRAIIKGYFLWR